MPSPSFKVWPMNTKTALGRISIVLLDGLIFGAFTPNTIPNARATGIEYNTDAGVHLVNVDATCPMIYDNDWWSDTPDKNYLWAKASLSEANLRGNIVTRDLWDYQKGYLFTLQQGLDDAAKSIAIARRSGLKNIPDVVAGASEVFARPASGRIEDTAFTRSAGSNLMVRAAKGATPQKPLLIFVGGPLNTVANAYLSAPEIAANIVVLMTDLQGYNGQDKWANFIVASRCKVVNYGARVWWPQRPQAPVMPLARFEQLPPSEMRDDIFKIARNFWERSTRADKPDRDDGFADGAPVFLVFDPHSWRRVQKQRINGVFDVQDVEAAPYDVLDARELDYARMTDEFFRTLSNAALYQKPEMPVQVLAGQNTP